MRRHCHIMYARDIRGRWPFRLRLLRAICVTLLSCYIYLVRVLCAVYATLYLSFCSTLGLLGFFSSKNVSSLNYRILCFVAPHSSSSRNHTYIYILYNIFSSPFFFLLTFFGCFVFFTATARAIIILIYTRVTNNYRDLRNRF